VNSPSERIQKVRSFSVDCSKHSRTNFNENKFLQRIFKNVGLKSVKSKSLYINGEEADITALNKADMEVLNIIGDKFDILYHKLKLKMR
jgi:hypothetical protein